MLDEKKGTCCHKCGHVHVKGTSCPTPYLKGERSCARRVKEGSASLLEIYENTILQEYSIKKEEARTNGNGVEYFKNAKSIVDVYGKRLKTLIDKYNAEL